VVQVSYRALLDEFFKRHDPTALNRQGNDVGTQYRGERLYCHCTASNNQYMLLLQQLLA
jgi:peptide methionine sulfoxide reductase MsrA